ncbi:hypothetical protein AwDysgo_10490 [Bacteroidales bacterium]|nr:hypothetical protein AwDysgo_10490 [Bacteroidales bacterium]
MKKINIWPFLAMALIFTSCINELDNYHAPNGGIKGLILDEETNKPIPLPVQGSTGVIINLTEQNTQATQSVDFYAKYDGSYENSQVFNCDYKVSVKGPFVSAYEGFITVNGITTFDLKALPYARIEAEASVVDGKISINYTVEKTKSSFLISEVYAYWNFAPGVDNGGANQAGKLTMQEVSGTAIFDLLNDENYKNNLHKIQAN